MNPIYLFGRKMTPLRKLLMTKAVAGGVPIVEYTATGNPLSFTTNIAKPLKSLTIPFVPYQSGTGDPSPENVRSISGTSGVNVVHCGENLLDNSRIVDTNVGTELTGDRKAVSFTKPGKYYVKALRTWNEAYLYARVKNADGTFGNILYVVANKTVQNKTVTLTEGQTLIMFNASTGVNGTVEKTIERFEGWGIVVSFEDMTAYAPYTGTSYPVTFPALGANLFNEQWGQGNIAAGRDEPSTTAMRTGFIDVDPSTAYYAYTTRTATVFMFEYDENGTYLNIVTNISNGKSFTTSAATKKIRIADRNSGTESVNTGINYPATVTTYEPYTNTVYGGNLDVTTGVLTVEYQRYRMKDYYWANFSQNITFYCAFSVKDKDSSFLISDSFPCVIGTPNEDQNMGTYGNGTNDGNRVFFYKTGMSSATDFNNWVQALEIDPYFVFKLATPITYQLTPQQITALIGDNVIWSDTNGTNTATYLKKG